MRLFVTKPQGYCFGVTRAIDLALKVRSDFPNAKITVVGMLVHNDEVTKLLEYNQISTKKGLKRKLIDFLRNVDPSTHLIFTAHGHPVEFNKIAHERNLIIHDATCKMVQLSLDKIKENLLSGHQVIYIGKKGHPEVEAALSISNNIFLYTNNKDFDFSKITDESPYVINQTTLSIFEIQSYHQRIMQRIPGARIVDEICNATRLRQEAVMKIPGEVDLIYIVGGDQSSNTAKLVEIAKLTHPDSIVKRIKTVADIDVNDLKAVTYIGISSGASTPPHLVDEIIHFLEGF